MIRRPNLKPGEKYTNDDGYVMVKAPDHPSANKRGYVLEHRMIMEANIRRKLKPSEHVHHINEIRDDNRLENLHLCNTIKEHNYFHRPPKKCHCGKPHMARGLCQKHYREWYYQVLFPSGDICAKCGQPCRHHTYKAKDGLNLCRDCRWPKIGCVECGKPTIAKGLCHAHYQRKFLVPCDKCGTLIRKGGRNHWPPLCWQCKFPKENCELCNGPRYALKLCINHHAKLRRLRKKRPELSRDQLVALIH